MDIHVTHPGSGCGSRWESKVLEQVLPPTTFSLPILLTMQFCYSCGASFSWLGGLTDEMEDHAPEKNSDSSFFAGSTVLPKPP